MEAGHGRNKELPESAAGTGPLTQLSVKGNILTRLPKDLSKLKKLRYLDLSDNPFQDIGDAIDGLVSIPGLKELKFDFKSKVRPLSPQEEEQFIIQSLPKLTFINGVKLQNDNNGAKVMPQKPRENKYAQSD